MPAGYFAPTVRLLWKTVESYDIDPAPYFRRCGVDPAALDDPEARVPASAAEALWAGLEPLTGDPAAGLRTADMLHPSHVGALGYAWLASRDLRTALGRLVRYVRIITDLRHMELIDNGEELELVTLYLVRAASVPTRADASLAMLVKMCRWNLGEDFTPGCVELQRPQPANAARYRELFRCPLYFGSGHDALSLSREDADRAATGDNPKLADLNDELVNDYLDRYDPDHLVGRVKGHIVAELPNGAPAIGRTADALCMSVRSLQRQLSKHGTSFRQQLEATRRELTEYYLAKPRLSIAEVAFRAGFRDMSAFTKRVRHWTGMTPGDYRLELTRHHPAAAPE